ncbi:hypothetical protein BJV74DRAFT_718360, partial [Russula compacta]
CPACLRSFKTTKGCTSHLRTAVSCSWYRQEKLAELPPLDLEGEGGDVEIVDHVEEFFGDSDIEGDWDILGRESESDLDEGAADAMDNIEDDDDLFHFIPLPRVHQRTLEDDDDTRVMEEFQGAGDVIGMNEHVHMRWKKIFNKGLDRDGDIRMGDEVSDDSASTWFHPFASELDWEVANWVVSESLGHKAFDRFMAIPGVKEKLGLSFNNIRALHKLVDAIPDRAGDWRTTNLSFSDRPSEKHTIQYRNMVDAIKCLWGDPALSKHMVYAPKKIFSDATKANRIYSEMWTGSWWHVIQ